MRSGIGIAFGLVSLLVSVAIVVYLWGRTMPATINAGKNAQQQARQVTNIGPSGMNAMQGIDLQPATTSGHLTGINVVSIDPANPLAARFGLLVGDVVVSLDGATVGKDEAADFETAKAILLSPHGPGWKMTVLRNGKETALSAR